MLRDMKTLQQVRAMEAFCSSPHSSKTQGAAYKEQFKPSLKGRKSD